MGVMVINDGNFCQIDVDAQYYFMKDSTYNIRTSCTFGCYLLFNQKICFEQDYYYMYYRTIKMVKTQEIESILNQNEFCTCNQIKVFQLFSVPPVISN